MNDHEPPITEPVPAPEIMVDGYLSTAVTNGVVKFTFFSFAHDPAANLQQRRIVLRLAAPMAAVIGIHEAIGRMLAQAEAMGAQKQ